MDNLHNYDLLGVKSQKQSINHCIYDISLITNETKTMLVVNF